MKLNCTKTNGNSTKSGNPMARDLTNKVAIIPDCPTSSPHTQKFTNLRPYSSPCRIYSRSVFQNMFRPSSTPAFANPVLSFSAVKQILRQRITEKGDALKKAFQLLDSSCSLTVSRAELRRTVNTFLLPLTREQFHKVLAQIPLTSSGAVPYLEFLSRFGGVDLNINVIKGDRGEKRNCSRTLKELEIQVGEKIFRNVETVIKALELIDVNKTGLVHAHELRRVLETFCVKMKDEEYRKFAQYYSIDEDTAVDYNVFLKNLSMNNDLNLRYTMGNQEVSWENQQVKNSKREHLPNSDSSGAFWEEPSLDDIERTFCQELSKSYERVEKALSAGDPSKSGCISLNYLKIVFDTFVYRLPRRIFIQLMKRFGLKTTSKVNWKQFLTSLYNPPWLDVNSAIHMTKQPSTNSTNRHHKENIITKLFRPEDHRTLLKKVLPTVNTAQKLDRQITGEELRHIINCMVVKISDSEFKELMQTLDPRGTGLVSVRALTELLQEDPQTGNLAPCTDTEAPLHPAQDSVEETFHDAITSNLVAFYNMLQSCDPKDTGLIGQNNFKKIMHVFCPLLTMEQLSKLCNEFQDVASGGILYKNLLASIGVSGLSPVFPVITPKDQPSSEHFQKEEQWLTPAERTVPAEDEDTVTKNTTTDEVMEKLRNGVQQQDPAFRKRFLGFSRELPGKMKVHDIRKVLEGNGMPVSDDQPAPLPANVGCKEGRSDLDVATGLEGTGRRGPGGTPRRTPVLPLSSWDSGLVTAEECLKLFPQRLREFFPDPYAAFFKIDTDQNGIINMRDLHRLLQHLLLSLKDEEFERFLGLLGLRLSMTLNFREFRNLFEKRPLRTDDAPQRLIRSKPKVMDSELACEQAHQYLVTKAKTRWTDLSKNFIETDNEGNGILRRRDIKNALYGFDIPLTPQEFEKLWTRYDTEGRGHVIYQEFLQKLGVNYSEDVHQPKSEDYFNFMGHFTKPQQIQEEIKELQRGAEEAVPPREKLQDHFQGISEGFRKLEKAEQGPVSVRAVQGVLRECGCPLTEQELTQLLDSWGISWQNNSINYHDFLRAVENSEPSRPQPKGKDDGVPSSFAALGPEEVLKNIQKVVATSSPALAEAFSALDKEDTGFVKASDFGHVLKDFCYELTDNQYHCFLRKLRIHLTPYINWKYFLQNFNRFLEKTAAEWAEKMPKGPPPRSPMETAARDTLAQLHKAVTCRYHAIAHEFENFDAAKTNTVSRDEFRAVCNRHVQILTDKQFDRLWNEMPVDAQGRLKYLHFLSRFLSEEVAAPLDTGDSAKAQKGASVPEVTEGNRSAVQSPTRDPKTGTKPRSHPSTPAGTAAVPGTPLLQNCEPLENTLRKKIQSCWRQLLKECKQRDIRKQGEITASEFLALVEKFNLDVNEKELQQLVMKYDLKGNGRFAYCNFIQSCVLLLKAKETSVMQRMKIQNAHKMEEAGPETSSFYSALLRIQPQIVHCWRPMRRAFKAYDERGTGLIGVADFRQVLRQYSINLSEEEFFHILQYYDKMLSSKISYNDFLRAFLQ